MAPIGDQHVAQALSELGNTGSGSPEPLLTAQQRDAFAKIAAETDPVAKAQLTVELGDELIRQASDLTAKGAEAMKEAGIEPAQVNAFLNGDRLDAGAQRAIQDSHQDFLAQVQQQVQQEAHSLADSTGSNRPGRDPRAIGVRV